MKKLIPFGIALFASCQLFAQQYTVSSTNAVVVAPAIKSTLNVPLWATGTVYTAGQTVKMALSSTNVWCAEVGGTSGTNSSVFTSTNLVSDGTVKWIPCIMGTRSGFIVQNVSGGNCSLSMNGGYYLLTAFGSVVGDSSYQGSISVTATNTLVGVSQW